MLHMLVAGLDAHWHALMVAMGCWIAVATFLATRWPKPAKDAKWYARAAHFAFVDLPALAATLNGKTWMGLKFSIPFITWTVRDPSSSPGDVIRFMLPFAIGWTLAVATLSGCASTMKDTLKVEDTLTVATSQLAHAVDGADALLNAKARAQLATDPAAAKATYAAYKPKIEHARAAVHTAHTTIGDADDARKAIPTGSGGTCSPPDPCAGDPKQFTAWLPTLKSVLVLIEDAYSELRKAVQ